MKRLGDVLEMVGITVFMMELVMYLFIDIPKLCMVIPVIAMIAGLVVSKVRIRLRKERRYNLKIERQRRRMGL